MIFLGLIIYEKYKKSNIIKTNLKWNIFKLFYFYIDELK